jgi:acyl-CoA reductase-like NAD-dependent aldehyde dehydrogenase
MTASQFNPPTDTDTLPVRRYGHFMGGEEVPARVSTERYSPSDGSLTAIFARGSSADGDRAVSLARAAFDAGAWPAFTGIERSRLLNAVAARMRTDADRLARIESLETGKPLTFAHGDVAGSIELFEYAAALAATSHGDAHTDLGDDCVALVAREPVGVVGMITPWNFPLLLLAQKLAFALAAGCTAVIKPSELTAGTTLELARIIHEAGAPAGVVNVVTGKGSEVGAAMVASADVDMLSFTGSTETGQRITAASAGSVKRLAMELGGKAASIVFDDASMDDAVDGVVFGALFNQGECCVQGARLLVQESIADEFVDRVERAFARVVVGPPLREGTEMGALIDAGHLDGVHRAVQEAIEAGARLRCGGERLMDASLRDGSFYPPTLLDDVGPEHRVFQEEIFGPVLTVTRFRDVDEAIQLANATRFGLAVSIWSKNIDRALLTARRVRNGRVWINTTIDGAPALPAGGMKQSGYGREMGRAGFDEFTDLKTIQIRTGDRAPSFQSSTPRQQ